MRFFIVCIQKIQVGSTAQSCYQYEGELAMGELGAIGDVVSGAVLARAVEPHTGHVASDGHTHEAACLNCATTLTGDYCHGCGQRGHVHRTLGAFFHDLLHGVLHFEGKIWRTLPRLVWRPGELTRDYIAGKRASFVSPIALFLFSVFLMFAIANSIDIGTFDEEFDQSVTQQLVADRKEVAGLEARRAAALAQRQPTTTLDQQIKSKREEIDILDVMRQRGITQASMSRSTLELPVDSPWIDRAYRKSKQNPSLLLYKLRNNAYKWSWALIPLSVPFLWLLFPFSRKYRLYDHMVFVTYSLAFMTLLAAIGSLLVAIGMEGAVAVAMFVPPIHMYRQLKGAYDLSRIGALWRTVLLVLFAVMTTILFVMLTLVMGLLD